MELRFRPDDPLCKPIYSTPAPPTTTSFVIKIKKRKLKKMLCCKSCAWFICSNDWQNSPIYCHMFKLWPVSDMNLLSHIKYKFRTISFDEITVTVTLHEPGGPGDEGQTWGQLGPGVRPDTWRHNVTLSPDAACHTQSILILLFWHMSLLEQDQKSIRSASLPSQFCSVFSAMSLCCRISITWVLQVIDFFH